MGVRVGWGGGVLVVHNHSDFRSGVGYQLAARTPIHDTVVTAWPYGRIGIQLF